MKFGARAFAVALVAVAGCSRSPKSDQPTPCSDLAKVGDTVVTGAELDFLLASPAAGGIILTREQGLKDLIWQEAERQRLGLPGGVEIQRSRRLAVQRYRRERSRRPALDVERLPAHAVLTSCADK